MQRPPAAAAPEGHAAAGAAAAEAAGCMLKALLSLHPTAIWQVWSHAILSQVASRVTVLEQAYGVVGIRNTASVSALLLDKQ